MRLIRRNRAGGTRTALEAVFSPGDQAGGPQVQVLGGSCSPGRDRAGVESPQATPEAQLRRAAPPGAPPPPPRDAAAACAGKARSPQSSGSACTAAARATRCTTCAWGTASSSASTRARASPTPPSTRTKSTRPGGRAGAGDAGLLAAWPPTAPEAAPAQVRRVPHRAEARGRQEHPAEPGAPAQPGGLGHLLLHQRHQGGELRLHRQAGGEAGEEGLLGAGSVRRVLPPAHAQHRGLRG